MPLNAAEKLNAMPGQMRDFIKNLAEHSFFRNKVFLSPNRYTHISVAAQIVLLEINGVTSAKFPDLKLLYNLNKKYKENSKTAVKVKNILDFLDRMFMDKSGIFKNKASIVSFYVLISRLKENGMELDKKNSESLRTFYDSFHKNLKAEVEKGVDAKDTELVYYQSKVTQSSDSKDSILKRHEILEKRLLGFEKRFDSFIKPSGDLQELIRLQENEKIKNLADTCIKNITSINKKSTSLQKTEVFKLTSEAFKSITNISSPAIKQEDFVNFIDALYKCIYESSGSLKRIPKVFIKDDSIFMDIKHLRTDAYHDIEHGSKKDIQTKRKRISSVYKKYSSSADLNSIPESELIKFQENLLLELNIVLTKIKKDIS